ncbi:MAG: hypothetical protein CBC22_03935 [Alphaproteobacteria bacterium TMED62]|nr:MAG: hypothetical protein CBC22_03935 [Alphaproteobacteria bacterium TMED62]
MKKKIYLFLNNKILTLDTVIPLIFDFKKENRNIEVIFYCFNKSTLDEINKNLFLLKLINNVGVLKILPSSSTIKIIRIFNIFFNLMFLLITSIFIKNTYIHFKALELFPFNVLYFTNKKNCFYIDPNPWGYIKNLEKSDDIFFKNKRFKDERPQKEIKYTKNIITFSKESPFVERMKKKKKKIFFLNFPRADKEWLKYCYKESQFFIKKNFSIKKIKDNKKLVLYLIGHFGAISGFDKNTNGKILFIKTIIQLKKINDVFIIFKPHPNANVKEIKRILKNLDFINYKISYMHTAVLASFCKYTISNYFSFALPDAWFANSITIEITKYDKEILSFTKNNSVGEEFVNYFIDSEDKNKLYEILSSKKHSLHKTHKKNYKDVSSIDLSKIIYNS